MCRAPITAPVWALLLLSHITYAIDPSSPFPSPEMGLSFGSSAAAKLVTHYTQSMLRHPRPLKMELQSAKDPWFASIAHIDVRSRVQIGEMIVHFRNGQAEAELLNVTLKSDADIKLLPLPFFIGEDTLHATAKIPSALLRLRVLEDGYTVELDECEVKVEQLDVELDQSYLLNWIVNPLHRLLLPRTLIHHKVCDALGKAMAKLRNRFAVEIPLSSLVPEKFIPQMVSPNVTLFTQLESITAEDELLIVSAIVEWTEGSSYSSSASPPDDSAVPPPPAATPSPPPSSTDQPPPSQTPTAAAQGPPSSLPTSSTANEDLQPRERLQLWVEDRLLNELLERFRWETEWIEERIPMESPKLPQSTSAFLSTLCTNCYFLLKVSGTGVPHISSVNSTIVLRKSDHIFMKVVNPSRNVDAVFVNFGLTLSVQLTPQLEEGVFRTQVDLRETEIRMQEGAFPQAWRFFVQDLTKSMISDVIWPGLKKEIEALTYSDGVQLPAQCGLEPASARLHFEKEGRLGGSAAFRLDDLSAAECLQQLKRKLPDPAKLFVIRETRAAAAEL